MCHSDTLHRSQVVCRVTGAQAEMVITCLQPAAKKRPLDTRPTWYKIALLVSSHSEANPRQLNLKRCQFKAMFRLCIFIFQTLLLIKDAFDNSLLNAHRNCVLFEILIITYVDTVMCGCTHIFLVSTFLVIGEKSRIKAELISPMYESTAPPVCSKPCLMTTSIRD